MSETRTDAPADPHYRAHLDGLRMVAVVLVIAFHSGITRLSGGFIGVDVFFVLSGFLVTGILVREIGSGSGIRWQRFLSRRVRRILPASLLTLVVTAIVYGAVANPLQRSEAYGGFRAAFFYVANWFFIRQSSDYFATDVASNPVLHFWSLAVEEQFYLVWPLLLGALSLATARAGRARWWVIRGVVLVAVVTSAVYALRIGETRLARAYYGTDTRAYELLAGALLALSPRLTRLGPRARRPAGYGAAIAVAAILLLASSAFAMSPITRGIGATAATLTLIVSLEGAPAGRVRRVLATTAAVALGRISYGMYLWHWPIIVIIGLRFDVPPPLLFAIAVIGSAVLATLSYHLIEQPVRRSAVLDRHRLPTAVIGFSTSILIGALVLPVLLDRGGTPVVASTGRELDWKTARRDIPALVDCLDRPVDDCVIVRGTGPKVVLMGDSIARMWIPAFRELAERRNWTLAVTAMAACPWQHELQQESMQIGVPSCVDARDDWYRRVIPEFAPDVIFVGQRGLDDPMRPKAIGPLGGGLTPITDPDYAPILELANTASLAELAAPGRTVVFLEPIPTARLGDDPLECVVEARRVEACRFPVTAEPLLLEQQIRALGVANPALVSLDLDRVVCPAKPECAVVVDEMIAWRDGLHITGSFARHLAPRLDTALADVLDR